IERQVRRVLESVKEPSPNAEPSSGQLYASVIAPVAGAISSKHRIVIVGDGPLYDVPFELLGSQPGTHLLTSHVVTYAPSATVYAMLSEEKASAAPLPVLAIGTGNDGPISDLTIASGKPFGTADKQAFETDTGQLVPLAA